MFWSYSELDCRMADLLYSVIGVFGFMAESMNTWKMLSIQAHPVDKLSRKLPKLETNTLNW